jgi:hypothetical protein
MVNKGRYGQSIWRKQMKKAAIISLIILCAAVLVTSFKSVGKSEVIMADNAALVVASKPVIESYSKMSEVEPEKYDSMIKKFYLDGDINTAESEEITENVEKTAVNLEQEIQLAPDSSETPESAENTLSTVDAEETVTEENETLNNSGDEIANENDNTTVAEIQPYKETQDLVQEDTPDTGIETAEIAEPENSIQADSGTFFTIQTGSYIYRVNAQNEYQSIVQDLIGSELSHLRIEKIGNYFAVRLGKFDDQVTAMKFLSSLKSHTATAMILNAYVKEERIVKSYKESFLAGK